jgi:Uma2 family endonuclease
MIVEFKAPLSLMTADEFYDFVERPENRARSFELVRGEVIEVSRPTRIHGRVCINTGFELEKYARKRKKGYVVSNDSGVILENDPDTVRGPDVAWYEDVFDFEALPKKWGDIPPRLAVEVLSPNDTARYITEKITDYLDNGVELVWVIEPEMRSVTIYSKTGIKKLTEKDTLTGNDVLPGFRCKVADLFVMPETAKSPTKKAKRSRKR